LITTLTWGQTVKAEKRSSDAEKKIDGIQAICLREKLTECICPNCGTHHRAKMLWTGRGMPRKFCPTCKHYSQSINETDPYVVCNVEVAL
jgi:ribosomal protein L32